MQLRRSEVCTYIGQQLLGSTTHLIRPNTDNVPCTSPVRSRWNPYSSRLTVFCMKLLQGMHKGALGNAIDIGAIQRADGGNARSWKPGQRMPDAVLQHSIQNPCCEPRHGQQDQPELVDTNGLQHGEQVTLWQWDIFLDFASDVAEEGIGDRCIWLTFELP